MSILMKKDTRVIIQGITGKYGTNQAKRMLGYGTKIVGGVSPGKQGSEVHGVPVYDSVAELAKEVPFEAAVIYVPAARVYQAAIDAIDGGAKIVMIGTEGMPLHECMKLKRIAEQKGVWLIGPNTIGMISPGECLLGSLAAEYGTKGGLGIVTRGGTVAIEMVRMFSEAGIGQTTCIGSGGDRVIGKNPIEYLKLFEADPDTRAVLLVGEIGGLKENECAQFIPQMTKPVFAYILGRYAPVGARMGHIGAIISSNGESHEEKCRVLAEAGAVIVNTPWEAIDKIKALGVC